MCGAKYVTLHGPCQSPSRPICGCAEHHCHPERKRRDSLVSRLWNEAPFEVTEAIGLTWRFPPGAKPKLQDRTLIKGAKIHLQKFFANSVVMEGMRMAHGVRDVRIRQAICNRIARHAKRVHRASGPETCGFFSPSGPWDLVTRETPPATPSGNPHRLKVILFLWPGVVGAVRV